MNVPLQVLGKLSRRLRYPVDGNTILWMAFLSLGPGIVIVVEVGWKRYIVSKYILSASPQVCWCMSVDILGPT